MAEMNTKDFLIGSLIGGIVGASAALLMAPKSGRELRDNINEQAQLAYTKSNEVASLAKEKSSDFAKVVSEQSNQVIGKVKEATASSTENVTDVAEEASVAEESNETDAVQQEVQELHESITEQSEKRQTTSS